MTKDKTVSEMYNETHPIDNDNEDLEIFLKNEPHWEIRPISDLEEEIEKLKASMSSEDAKRNSFIRAEIDRFLGLIFVMKSERGKQQLYKNLENTIKYICLIEGNVFNIENTEGLTVYQKANMTQVLWQDTKYMQYKKYLTTLQFLFAPRVVCDVKRQILERLTSTTEFKQLKIDLPNLK